MSLARRSLMAGVPLLAAVALAAPVPRAPTQVPGVLRLPVGRFQVTALLDGFVDIPLAALPAATEAEAAPLYRAAPSLNPMRSAVNAYLVNDGARTVLIDAGTGPGFIDTADRLPGNLAAAGVAADSVDAVVATHLHVDHVGGMVGADGAPRFPNAELVANPADIAFWSDAGIAARAPAEAQPFFAVARRVLDAYRSRIRPLAEGEAFPGIRAVPMAGHTPGHTGWLVADGPASLLVWGDLVHVPALQFARPAWGIAFDVDQAAAAATRARVLDRVAQDRQLVAGMHLDFPGVGFVERRGEAFGFTPLAWPYVP